MPTFLAIDTVGGANFEGYGLRNVGTLEVTGQSTLYGVTVGAGGLSVQGTVTVGALTQYTGDFVINAGGTNNLHLQTASITRMTIAAGGNVTVVNALGVGAGLTVTGTTDFGNRIRFSANGAASDYAIYRSATGGLVMRAGPGSTNDFELLDRGGGTVARLQASSSMLIIPSALFTSSTTTGTHTTGNLAVTNSANIAGAFVANSTATLASLDVQSNGVVQGSFQVNINTTLIGTLSVGGLATVDALLVHRTSGSGGNLFHLVNSSGTTVLTTGNAGLTTIYGLEVTASLNVLSGGIIAGALSVGSLTQVTGNFAISAGGANDMIFSTGGAERGRFRNSDGWFTTTGGVLTTTLITGTIHRGTLDGADNNALTVAGGGAGSINRGALINLFGNESGAPGAIQIIAGDVSGGVIDFYTGPGPAKRMTMDRAGILVFGPGTAVGTAAAGGFRAIGTSQFDQHLVMGSPSVESWNTSYRVIQWASGAIMGATAFGGNGLYILANTYNDGGNWRYQAASTPASAITTGGGTLSYLSAAGGAVNAVVSWSTLMTVDPVAGAFFATQLKSPVIRPGSGLYNALSNIIEYDYTWDPPLIAAGDFYTQLIAVGGVQVGDTVAFSNPFQNDSGMLTLSVYVYATDNVMLTLINAGSGSIDPASRVVPMTFIRTTA